MNIKKLLLVVFATLTFYSCQEQFVDDPAPVDGISEALVFSNRSMVDAFLAGMGRRIRRQFTATDTNGINGMYYACLLYTSPSPRDLYRSRMPSSA